MRAFLRQPGGGRQSNTLAVTGLWSLLSLSMPSMAIAKTAADYFVHSLPGQPEGPLLKMHAGHIEVDPVHHGNLFFWLYENQHIADRKKTVIWLNGGPGCSSEDGVLMEIGPYRLKDEAHLEYNPGSWDKFANIIFVDNPVGTGFSYVDSDSYLHELDEMAAQFMIFLKEFFTIFPEFEEDDLYISGESYAGQHIPYIAKAILDRNKEAAIHHKWNLAGLLIGNGWISPYEQYPSYLTYAYEAGMVEKGSEMAASLEKQQVACQHLLDAGGKNHVDTSQCENILSDILQLTQTPGDDGESMCYNMYDVSLKDIYPSCGMNWPPDLVNMNPYLRRKDVLQALNIGDVQLPGWVECSGSVGAAFRASNSIPSVQLLPDLLSQIPIVLFSGALDLICNHLGTEGLINNLEWNGGKGFEISPGNWAPRRDWTFEGEAAGFYQEARNLTYVLFHNSSHMVPFDYALRSQDMLNRFMGIDAKAIAGDPVDSHIDGEKVDETKPTTPMTPQPNKPSNPAELPNPTPAETAALEATKWQAYYRAGEVGLVIVILAAGAWGWYIWKERRKRAGYSGLFGGAASQNDSRFGLDGVHDRFRTKRNSARDVEAADFDESELDDLHVVTPSEGLDVDRYDVGSDSDEEADGEGGEKNGKGVGKKADRS